MDDETRIEIFDVQFQPTNHFAAGVGIATIHVDFTTEVVIEEHNIEFLCFEKFNACLSRLDIRNRMSRQCLAKDSDPSRVVLKNEDSMSGSQHVCKGSVRVLCCGLFALLSVYRLECLFGQHSRFS